MARRRSAKAGTRSPKRTRVTIGKSRIMFALSPRDVAKAKKCLERSGTIKFVFKEIRATKLPHAKDDGVLID